MKQVFVFLISSALMLSCSDDFLTRYPKGYYHPGNYKPSDSIPSEIIAESYVVLAYESLRDYHFIFPVLGMHNYTTPDAEKGSLPNDGGGGALEFKPMSYGASTAQIVNFYNACYKAISKSNEALETINLLSESGVSMEVLKSEALFLRAVMYYRLAQAFGGVPYMDKVLTSGAKKPARSSREEIWKHIEEDLLQAIPLLPSRENLIATGRSGRATANAARAVLAKTYMYQNKWSETLSMTSAIIASGDNALTTAYADIWTEANEFGPESVFEVNCEFKPDDKIQAGSQWAQVQGVRGVPNMGWGFNAPSQLLMDSYEAGDPRKEATVIADGDMLDDRKVKVAAGSYPYFNKKAYVRASERGIFGRPPFSQGYWMNIRIIRYADVLLMHAEAALETGNIDEALTKLEMVRSRARGGNPSVLPEITERESSILREKIRQERRIELALEFERFFDLVRWGIAKDVIPNFVPNKHELFPIPQEEIDRSEGVIVQNPGY